VFSEFGLSCIEEGISLVELLTLMKAGSKKRMRNPGNLLENNFKQQK
jgi:hypothetical protein